MEINGVTVLNVIQSTEVCTWVFVTVIIMMFAGLLVALVADFYSSWFAAGVSIVVSAVLFLLAILFMSAFVPDSVFTKSHMTYDCLVDDTVDWKMLYDNYEISNSGMIVHLEEKH